MSRHFLNTMNEEEMRKQSERVARQQWQGEVAGPRVFQRPGTYSAAELRHNWRSTIWDTVPSLMAGVRVPR
jgi:hypothetical protein